MRIGIDFDNTIACYDRVLREVAATMGYADGVGAYSKLAIKQCILESTGGDFDWQRLQGQIYGKHMLRAELYPGFMEFLCLCRVRGHQVFVVSHKTEFGHFDTERIPLRDRASQWMEVNRFFEGGLPLLNRADVYFESTREAKVARIRQLQCTHFIDDLPAVFEERGFPEAIKKILFAPGRESVGTDELPTFASWRDLGEALLGIATETEIAAMTALRFRELNVENVELRKGGGNSRLYRLSLGTPRRALALKVYPDRQHDARTRLQTEFTACKELKRLGYSVPGVYAADAALNWGLYEWVEGDSINHVDECFINEAASFVERLYSDSHNDSFSQVSSQLGLASEACLSGREILSQIEERLGRLASVKSPELQQFLDEKFRPLLASAAAIARANCGETFNTELDQALHIASPSDFGSHNVLRLTDAGILFLDFEYFGWDDPVKLTADCYWHPAMRMGASAKAKWLYHCKRIFRGDASFELRLLSYLPLFGLKWSLIILNEFLPRHAAARVHANPHKAKDLPGIKMAQFEKAAALLREIKEMVDELGSAVTTP